MLIELEGLLERLAAAQHVAPEEVRRIRDRLQALREDYLRKRQDRERSREHPGSDAVARPRPSQAPGNSLPQRPGAGLGARGEIGGDRLRRCR